MCIGFAPRDLLRAVQGNQAFLRHPVSHTRAYFLSIMSMLMTHLSVCRIALVGLASLAVVYGLKYFGGRGQTGKK